MRALSANWSFAQVAPSLSWLPVTQMPTTVHVELLKQNKIPDPFVGFGDAKVQWVGDADWTFRTTFSVDKAELAQPYVDLVFEGLDTFATVNLNGKTILNASNQFVPYRVAAKDALKSTSNELEITFASSLRKGRELELKHGKFFNLNGDSSRLHVRKAPYNYGWDWGPTLLTAGPWKPIQLHAYTSRLSDVRVHVDVDEALHAKIAVTAVASRGAAKAAFIIKDPKGNTIHQAQVNLDRNQKATLNYAPQPKNVQLWYPAGYGKQPIYTSEVRLLDAHGRTLDTRVDKFGIRRVRVVEDKLVDQDGLSFLFEVNNVRIFAGGSNWIPADSFLTTLTPERYREWLQLVVDGNQRMLRVWGGGIYESDVFYDTCDELGIMVWQDFLFADGQSPAYDEFLQEVTADVQANVARLRHHPSLVLFAGNNEDYTLAELVGLELDYSDETSDYRDTNFPARYIYERLQPPAVNNLSDVSYHRGSPYSGHQKLSTDQTYGDLHQWQVWHNSTSYQEWSRLAGRFVSEFGMQSYPDIRTVDYLLGGNALDRYPHSPTLLNHNRGNEETLETYLQQNFKHNSATDIESYVYYTHILQADAVSLAFRLWRREWKGRGKEYVAGVLVWQLNDCWPVTSWALVDYFLRPKPVYYAVARELASISVGAVRGNGTGVEIWASNLSLKPVKAKLEVRAFDLHDPKFLDGWEKDVELGPNASTELYAGPLVSKGAESQGKTSRTIVLGLRLLSRDGKVLARVSNWPEPYKDIDFPPVEALGLNATVGADGETVSLTTKVPVKAIVLDVADRSDPEVNWNDQAIDLLPGDAQVVRGRGLAGREIKLRFLGDGTA